MFDKNSRLFPTRILPAAKYERPQSPSVPAQKLPEVKISLRAVLILALWNPMIKATSEYPV